MTAVIGAPPPEDIDLRRLESWLSGQIGGFQGPVQLTKFPGGQSNPTYRLDSAGASYVLRRKPFGPLLPSAHAVDREHRLIAALHPTGFPVARPYALCTDDSVIGSMFYVMELVDGRSLADGSLPDETPETRAAMYRSLTTTLAGLHNVDQVQRIVAEKLIKLCGVPHEQLFERRDKPVSGDHLAYPR